MEEDKTGLQVKLSDGRLLGYAEYGGPQGKPILYFHGFPSSRLDWLLSDSNNVAAELNARIIAVDRPGMGLSDHKPDREILDWPDDVAELADALKLDRFAVLGMSGGGPYAATCAYKLPERLTATGIVSGMGPSDAPGAKEGLSWTWPGKPRFVRWLVFKLLASGLRRDPEKVYKRFVTSMKKALAEPDALVMDQPGMSEIFFDGFKEALCSGTGGASRDAVLYTRPWGFDLHDIKADVHLWHGGMDKNVLPSVGRYVADAIPNCNANFLKDEAHLSLPYNHIREILGALIA